MSISPCWYVALCLGYVSQVYIKTKKIKEMKLKGAWCGLAYRELFKFDTRLNVTTSNVHKSALLSQCTCHIQRIGLLCLSSDLSFFISFMSWLFWSTLCTLCILSCLLDYNRFNILFVFANNGRFCEYWVAKI